MSYYDFRESNLAKKYVLVDIEKREFFKEHVKLSGIIGKKDYSKFDEDAIKEILTNYYPEVEKVMQNEITSINVAYFFNGDICPLGHVTKAIFARKVENLYNAGKLNDVPNIQSIYSHLMQQTNILQTEFPETHVIRIDDENFKIPSKIILDFILGDYQKYNFSNKDWNIEGLNRDMFCFAVKDFVNRYMLIEKYRFNEGTLKLLNDLTNDNLVNTMHFNKHLQIYDEYLCEFELNDELKYLILDEMPTNYNELEKAIYIYIKLCKHLTYDPEFYANNQAGMIARQHEDISRLQTISASERRIVCYEFTQLYAKFLFHFGINYKVDGGMDYGSAHSKLEFRAGDFVVEADSVTNILGGDLYNAKTNSELVGLVCRNKHMPTRKDFEQTYRKVYEDITYKEESKKTDEDVFYDFLEMFDGLCKKEKVSMQDKIKVLEKQLKDANLPTMEKLVYGLKLSKAIFREEIANHQFDVTIISKKIIDNFNIKTMPILIFSFNEKSFGTSSTTSIYKTFDSNGQLQQVDKKDIIDGFKTGLYKHITRGVADRHIIPGIDLAEGRE